MIKVRGKVRVRATVKVRGKVRVSVGDYGYD